MAYEETLEALKAAFESFSLLVVSPDAIYQNARRDRTFKEISNAVTAPLAVADLAGDLAALASDIASIRRSMQEMDEAAVRTGIEIVRRKAEISAARDLMARLDPTRGPEAQGAGAAAAGQAFRSAGEAGEAAGFAEQMDTMGRVAAFEAEDAAARHRAEAARLDREEAAANEMAEVMLSRGSTVSYIHRRAYQSMVLRDTVEECSAKAAAFLLGTDHLAMVHAPFARPPRLPQGIDDALVFARWAQRVVERDAQGRMVSLVVIPFRQPRSASLKFLQTEVTEGSNDTRVFKGSLAETASLREYKRPRMLGFAVRSSLRRMEPGDPLRSLAFGVTVRMPKQRVSGQLTEGALDPSSGSQDPTQDFPAKIDAVAGEADRWMLPTDFRIDDVMAFDGLDVPLMRNPMVMNRTPFGEWRFIVDMAGVNNGNVRVEVNDDLLLDLKLILQISHELH